MFNIYDAASQLTDIADEMSKNTKAVSDSGYSFIIGVVDAESTCTLAIMGDAEGIYKMAQEIASTIVPLIIEEKINEEDNTELN